MKKLIKFSVSVFFLLIFCFTFAFLIIGFKGFYAPSWALSKFENELNKLLDGTSASIGDVRIQFFNNGNFLSTKLFKIVLKDISSNQLAYLNELEATFGYEVMSSLNLLPNSLLISNSTLIITEKQGLVDKGAGINFIIKNNHQKFELNKKNVEKYKLKVSSNLEALAFSVK